MSNPFKNPKIVAKKGLNPFPLAHTEAFTAPFGALLPCCYYHIAPGTKIRINMENQTIMTPVIKPPFARLFEHFEFFAVPMCQLHQGFDNLLTSQSNYENAAIGYFNQNTEGDYTTPSQVPMFNGNMIERLLYIYHTQNDLFGTNKAANMCRLFDLLGYGNFYHVVVDGLDKPSEVPDSSTDPQRYLRNLLPVNYYNLLAYQKIYYSHYCNSRYEAIDTAAFNIDDMPKTVSSGSETINAEMSRMSHICELHYRWKSRDYFTSVVPNVLPTSDDFGFTDMDQFPLPSSHAFQIFGVSGLDAAISDDLMYVDNTTSPTYPASGGTTVNVDSGNSLSVSQIRFAFAYDKLLRRMRAAGSDFNSQMLAQFGIAPSDARHGAAKYLGGYTNQLRFDQVTSTTENDSASLGDIAGKMTAYNNNSKYIEYTAKENTIIMGIYSTSVDLQYHSFGQVRENLRRYRFDWFNPVFQDMGKQALFNTEYSYIPNNIYRNKAKERIDSTSSLKRVIGYVNRYLEYKTKVNRVHGLMQWPYSNPDGSAWVVQNNDLKQTNSSDPDMRWQILSVAPLSMQNLLLSPFQLNEIVSTVYSGAWNTDHFNVFAYFNTKVLAPMSVEGETY